MIQMLYALQVAVVISLAAAGIALAAARLLALHRRRRTRHVSSRQSLQPRQDTDRNRATTQTPVPRRARRRTKLNRQRAIRPT